jgi:hypothetical protein
MQKIGAWYLMGLAGLLIWIGFVLSWVNRLVTFHLEGLGCVALPYLSRIVITTHQWPYWLAGVTFGLAAVGLTRPIDNRILLHASFWIFVVSLLGMLAAVVGYTVPWVPPITSP